VTKPGFTPRGRTFLAGKVISNFGQSSIDCVIRRITDDGCVIELESVLGLPEHFHLLIPGEGDPQPCKRSWQSDRQVGVLFEAAMVAATPGAVEAKGEEHIVRGQMLALRAALDEIEVGVVLLGPDMKSRFINRAFRRMWALPDAVADANPAFVALMYHGRNTNAYAIDPTDLDAYVADRVRRVKEGDAAPLDLRRSNGDVIRVQCARLPNGGRMLSYTYITDIVRHSDELELLRNALDNVSEGVVMLDRDLNARFLNRIMREYWGVTREQAERHPNFASLIANSPYTTDGGRTADERRAFFADRVAAVRNGNETLRDLQTTDGRHIRAHCAVLEDGGRMLTYCDVSDLIHNARQMELLATVDALTGLYNRRHFWTLGAAEWSRFQRYYRPLSVLMIDVDHFKSVNDQYGHAVGDQTLLRVADCCREAKRSSDIVARVGGEEFAILLPETDLGHSRIVAERIRQAIAASDLVAHQVHFKITVSIGFAAASVSMSSFEALLHGADDALYQAKSSGRNRCVAWSPPAAPKRAAE
jgi:diguanylate cyclase (GGDEF)-like protein